MKECPICGWKYDPDEWDGWHEIPAHNFPPCEGGGTKLEVPTPCRATLEVYVKEIRNSVAVVFVQSEQAVDHYPFTVPIEHLSGFRMMKMIERDGITGKWPPLDTAKPAKAS